MQLHLFNAIIEGLFLGLFLAVSVGPTLFAVIKYSLEYSYKAGLAFVLGVSVSDFMYVALANYAATWLQALEKYKNNLAYGGAAILIVVGVIGLIKKPKPTTQETGTITITKGAYIKVWASGFLINTINPGVIISWLTAVTATANKPTVYRATLFGVCLVLILSIDFLKVFLADKIKQKLTAHRVVLLQKLSSFILMVLGLILAFGTYYGK